MPKEKVAFIHGGENYADVKACDMLEAAKNVLDEGMVIGFDNDGRSYIASTTGNVLHNIGMLELMKNDLLNNIEEG